MLLKSAKNTVVSKVGHFAALVDTVLLNSAA